LEEFAEALIREVRDVAISNMDRAFDFADVQGRFWRETVRTDSARVAVLELMPDIVDATLMRLLDAVDEGSLELLFRTKDGNLLDLRKDGRGELLGFYASEDWLRDFAGQRFHGYMDETKFPPPEVPPLRDDP
jgi:hypothetical protein